MLYSSAMTATLTAHDPATQLRVENEELKRRLIEHTEALLAARRDLTVLDRMKRDFITLISHELRTPITSIVGLADLIRNGLYETTSDLKQMSGSITDEAIRLSRFVDDVVEYLQWASGQVSTRMVPIDIPSVAREAMGRLSERYKDKSLAVSFQGESCLEIDADFQSIHSCLVRVLDNAMKFSLPGGKIEIRIERVGGTESCDEGWAILYVRDEGQGISQESLEDLYKALTLCHSYQNHSRGTGLGLAISREILRAHGATIRIESPGPGLGCEAILRFPIRQRAVRARRAE